MKNQISGNSIKRLAYVAFSLVVLASIIGCQRFQPTPTIALEWAPFVELARKAQCADVRNRLFVIDQTLVFADSAGNCADASYSQILYGKTVDAVLCVNHDSIAGPVKKC